MKTGLSAFFATSNREQHFIRIQQRARRGDNVIVRRSDANDVVAQLKRELAAAQVLFVLPTRGVGVGHHARKPLGNLVDVVALFATLILEVLETSAAADQFRVIDLVMPLNVERELLAVSKRLGQIHSHHRLDDAVLQRLLERVNHRLNLEGSVKCLSRLDSVQRVERHAAHRRWGRSGQHGIGVRGKQIPVQLEPQVSQSVRRVVVISDLFATANRLIVIVQFNIDNVVGALLPILAARRARCSAIAVGRWEQLLKLAELIFLLVLPIGERLRHQHRGQGRRHDDGTDKGMAERRTIHSGFHSDF